MNSKAKEFYDKEVLDYHNHMILTKHYNAQKRLFTKFKIYLQDPILDLACGPGYLLSLICKNHKDVYANDISKEMIKFASSNCNAIYMNQNAELIKSKIKFQTLICSNIFFYLNQNKAIKNWRTLLNQKGKVIVLEEYPFLISNNKTNFGKNKRQIKKLVTPKRPEEIKIILESNKFKLIQKYKTKIDSKHYLYCQIFEKI